MRVGLALAVFYALGWAPLYFIRTERLTEAFPQYDRAERWSTLSSAVLMSVHITLACITVSLTSSIVTWRALLSVFCFASGIAFWLWARAYIGPFGVRRLPDDPPPRFCRDGPFGLVRNPLYLGALVAAGAPLIVAPRPWLLVTYASCIVALTIRTELEERRLHKFLGADYAAYCREVKRLVPYIW